MKQINDLIIIEVPKGASDFEICIDGTVTNTPHQLPPGQYEIIGLYGKLNHIQMREAYDAAGKTWAGSIWDWLDMPTDTTDLLFIKRLA